MNYAAIANLVHEGVKNSKSLLTQLKSEEKKLNSNEITVIQNVLARNQVSGGTVAIEPPITPLLYWG